MTGRPTQDKGRERLWRTDRLEAPVIKFAATQILSARIGDHRPRTFVTAHRHAFAYEARPGFLYVRSRAISSRCNDNWDEFPADEIAASYKTFVGKPVFVNHVNHDHRTARGVVIDAALHEDHNPDGSPDTWCEVLMEIDAKRFPRLAKAILDGHVDRTSMGTDVAYSICSACGNRATTPAEYCQHIPRQKGGILYRHTASGRRVGERIREICHGLGFFENSLLVEPPADPTAYFLGVDASGLGKKAALSRQPGTGQEESGSVQGARREDAAAFDHIAPGGHKSPGGILDSAFSDRMPLEGRAPDALPEDTGGGIIHNLRRRRQERAHDEESEEARSWREQAVSHSEPFAAPLPPSLNALVDPQDILADGTLRAEAAGPKYPVASDHPWFQAHPVHSDHVIAHWDKATPEERAQGERWYSDAHLVAKAIARLHPGIRSDAEAAHKGAGVLSAYSPRTNWSANMHNAARTFATQKAVAKGEGISIMDVHHQAAEKILAGTPHGEALNGPKTQDFAHLIEHGGNEPLPRRTAKPTPSRRVVIDAHALSVAAGHRLSSADAGMWPGATRHYYEHVADTYRDAAAVLSHREGRTIAPHQVQAVTWLVRQRLNSDEGGGSGGEKGRATVQRNNRDQWKGLAREHGITNAVGEGNQHTAVIDPGLIAADGTIRPLAYGEIKAPAEVDTLREDRCPVCGDGEQYDGIQCRICGFISPPEQFRDPDLDAARLMDLRKQVVDPSELDDNGTIVPTTPDGALPGADGTPVPMVGADGQPVDGSDPLLLGGTPGPDGAVPGAMDSNGDGMVDDSQIGPDGQVLDPEQGGQAMPRQLPYRAQDHTGEPFTKGPDMPDDPGVPDLPIGPDGVPLPDADQTEPHAAPMQEMPMPGMPGDAVSDLLCPACGFTAPATMPQTQTMDNPNAASDGIVAGDVCPNCQRAQLLTPGELQGQDSPPPVVPGAQPGRV